MDESRASLKGTGFSPYISPRKISWALAPEGEFIETAAVQNDSANARHSCALLYSTVAGVFRIQRCVQKITEYAEALKGHGFSRAAELAK
jgi:hypothetical protein